MIKTENLNFEYAAFDETEAPLPVLNGIDISIKKGDFVAILGHNGSGKSTLARHMNALLTPTVGSLWVNGMDTKDLANLWEIRRTTGMLFQNPDNQIVASIVEEDVAFGPENLGIPTEEIRRRVDDALKVVNMTDYTTSPPHHLSGGQKQRVAIAGVLAMAPDCIVLDEPTAMLDPSGRREVLDTVTRLNKEAGITVILITHFMEEAVHAGRVLVMEKGKIVMDGTPREVFSQLDTMQKLGLGVPQVTVLAHELQFPHTILTVDEFLNSPLCDTLTKAATITKDTAISIQSSQSSPTAIELRSLSHTYNPNSVFEKSAITNINLKIYRGEMVSIIGHTGSGKSTLIQHLNALLSPTSGQVLINDQDITDKKLLKQIRQKIGLVFQYPEHQLFEQTIYKDVAFGPKQMGLSDEETNERVRDALAVVGIDHSLYEKSPFELSGGQKRRVAIAGVLAMRPQILILDEPAAGLDPAGKDEILSQVKHMHATLGITVILVSHSMEDVARLSDRIFVMNKGNLAYEGTPTKVFENEELLREIGLDTPPISQIFTALHEKNPFIKKGIFSTEDAVIYIQKNLASVSHWSSANPPFPHKEGRESL